MKNYDGLVIGSGRELGLVALGRLYTLHKRGSLKDVKAYSGCSVGSIICFFLSIGYDPHDIRSIAIDAKLVDIHQLSFTNMLTSMGLQKHEVISKFIELELMERYGKIITLKEHFQITGKVLYLCVTNLTKKRREYISYQSHPHISVVKALEMSFSIPGLFEKCEWREQIYVDGSVTDPLPVTPLADMKGNILVLHMHRKIKNENNNIIQYYNSIYDVIDRTLTLPSLDMCKKDNFTLETIEIDDNTILVTKEKKMEYYDYGRSL